MNDVLSVELFIVDRRDASADGVRFGVRVHSGSVRVGDRFATAVDESGRLRDVDLVIREMRISPSRTVDALASNFGGELLIAGRGVDDLHSRWVLVGEEPERTPN